ncbi:MAG: hypothetical protein RIR00_1706, partial [Pseudomonadota bacterium]
MLGIRKRYWVLLLLAFLAGLDWYMRAPDAQSRALTRAIEAEGSEKLRNYPYQFWVMKVVNGTAYVSTPRNYEVPAAKALAAMYPDLNTRNPNDPKFIAAQELLGQVQTEARAIVLEQPGIKAVEWSLDRDWVRSQF